MLGGEWADLSGMCSLRPCLARIQATQEGIAHKVLSSGTGSRVRIGPGEMQVSSDRTVTFFAPALGGAMALAVYDPLAFVGGVLVFMYPDSQIHGAKAGQRAEFFADLGVPRLIRALLDAGAGKERLVCKLAGGSSVIDPSATFNPVEDNRAAAERALALLGLTISAEKLGGHARLGVAFKLRTGILTLTTHGGQEVEVA